MMIMKQILVALSMLVMVGCCAAVGTPAPSSVSNGKLGGATSTSINAGQPNVFNYTISSCTAIIPADGTNTNWWIFAEDNDMRCLPQYYGTKTNCPTASVGMLVKGAGAAVTAYPTSDPTLEWDCIPTGASTKVSVVIDKRQG